MKIKKSITTIIKKSVVEFGILGIIIFLILSMIFLQRKDVKLFENLEPTTLNKVIMYYPSENVTIIEEADIQKIISFLQSMHLRKSSPCDKDGGFELELYYQNGNKSHICITSEHIAMDGKYYKCDRDYCNDFCALYKEFSE